MNTGRWNEIEHERYLKAMKSFKNWKTVADIVETRTIHQCRSHDQKIKKLLTNKYKNHRIPNEEFDKVRNIIDNKIKYIFQILTDKKISNSTKERINNNLINMKNDINEILKKNEM